MVKDKSTLTGRTRLSGATPSTHSTTRVRYRAFLNGWSTRSRLRTKQRVVLQGGCVLDLHFNGAQGKYSYTLAREDRRIIGWDNAPHHPGLTSSPHHLHREDRSVVPSSLVGVPEEDKGVVAATLNRFLADRL